MDQVTVRGRGGYWLVLNTGERALYWEEDDSAVTITSGLKDENTLKWAEALTAYEAGTIPLVDPAETQATRIP